MPIILPSGVANAKGTPAIISDDVNIASLPASDYAAGTLYIDYDRSVIYSNYQSSSWILIADVGGGGGGGTLQQVLDAGNIAGGANAYIFLYDSVLLDGQIGVYSFNSIELQDQLGGNQLNIYRNGGTSLPEINCINVIDNKNSQLTSNDLHFQNVLYQSNLNSILLQFSDPDGNGYASFLSARSLAVDDNNEERYSQYGASYFNLWFRNQNKRITANVNQDEPPTIKLLDTEEGEQLTIGNYYIEFRDIISDKTQTIYPSNANYNDQLIFLPEDTGTLSLQDPPYYDALLDLSAGSITPNIDKNSIIQIIVGDAINSINLDKDRWKDKVTLTICNKATLTARVDVTNGFLYGNNVLSQGLYYITYLDSTESFYITG